MTKKTEIATFKGKTTLAERKERVGQGSQNVSATDMAIPRIKLLQLINKEVMPSDPQYVEGAQAGMFMNSVTNELHSAIYVVNLHFSRSTMVWKKRKFGGGMFGSFNSEEEAVAALEREDEPVANYDISENPTHLLMLVTEDGEPDGIALLDMPGSKVKYSKKWNTLIAAQEEAGNPRFGCLWELTVLADSSSSGPFSNCEAKFITHAPDSIYSAAAKAYDTFFGTEKDENSEDE